MTSASNKLRTTRLALPEDVSRTVYATDGYDASVANLAQTSLQMATVTSSVGSGLTATLNIPV